MWIPRYSYTIQGKYGRGGTSAELPGAIDIKFLSESDPTEKGLASYTGNEQKEWRTPDAFSFGGTTQAGIWVGKFETTGSLSTTIQACINESCDASKITIKPGEPSLRNQRVSSFFYAARSVQNDTKTFGFDNTKGDLHMIKNDEWGAVAYLSQSKYGKHGNTDYTGKYEEVYQNKSSTFITGSSNGTPSQKESILTQYAYNDMTDLGEGKGQAGPGASTTGNIYGIYDMSGGNWEFVMGVLAYYEDNSPMSGPSVYQNSGFTGKVYEDGNYADYVHDPPFPFPDKKYYNLYEVATTKDDMPSSSDLKNSVNACKGEICYGQALSETSGWYGDHVGFPYRKNTWSVRGGHYSNITHAGVFYSDNADGDAYDDYGSRFVLTP